MVFSQRNTASSAARGFSLIEFMVALLLGTIIIGGASSVYLATKRSYTEVERFADLSENGRFALEMMTYSLRHVGFFGGVLGQDVSLDGNLSAVSGECAGGAGEGLAFNTLNNFFVVRATSSNVFSCIDDAKIGSDVVVIKSGRPSPLYDADPSDPNEAPDGVIPAGLFDDDTVYLVAGRLNGLLVEGDDTMPTVGSGGELPFGVAWPYVFEIYYVQQADPINDVPVLSRKVLRRDGTAWQVETEQLVHGVERLVLRLGLDDPADADWEVDTYTNANGVGAGNWSQVASAEVFLLMRNVEEDPGYTDAKTYQLGDVAVVPDPNEGSYHRMLLHGSVNLRNPSLALK